MSSMIKKAVGAALAAAVALPMTAAMAADLYGGGATFPAVPYVGTDFQASNNRLSSTASVTGAAPVSAASVFGTFAAVTGNNMTYCQTGSGTGKNVLTTLNPPANGACGLFSGTPAGFSAPAAQPSYPNYVGTDSPISLTDYNNFNTNHGAAHTALVQIPSLVGAVTLPMKLTGFSRINLTTAQVCSIFSGATKNWNELDASFPSTTITVVYRSDNSGTSFAFSNFLARNCNSGTTPTFITNQTYSAAAPVGNYAVSSAQSGNFNVVSTVNNTEGAIGYADPGDVVNLGVDYANVNAFDPLALTSPTVVGANLLQNQVIGSPDATTGLPTTTAAPTSVSGALTLINPATVFSGTYPILAPTYLAMYNTGNGADVSTALQTLGRCLHNRSGAPAGCRATLPAGYAYLNGNAVFFARVDTAIGLIGQ